MSVQKKRIISIFTFFLILIAFFNINSELSYTEVGEDISVSLDDDWTIISDDFCFEKANISETVFTQRKKGDMITYFSVLPQTDIPNPILVLYTIHEDIEVFLDDVSVYQYGQEQYEAGTLVGYGYHFVNLPNDYAGKEVKVVCHIAVDNAYTRLQVPQICDGAKYLRQFVMDNKNDLAIDLFLLIFGLILMLVSVIFMASNKEFFKLLCAGSFSVGVAVWGLCNHDLIILFTYEPRVKTFMEFGALFCAPIPFIMYFWRDMHEYYDKVTRIIYDAIVVIQIVFTVTAYMMDLLNIVHLPELLVGEHLILCLVILFMGILSARDIIRHQFRYKALFFGMGVMLFAGILDIVRFNIKKYVTFNEQRFTSILGLGTLLFVMGQIVDFCSGISHVLYENAKTETLEKLAYTDALTGISNRRRCEEELDRIDNEDKNYGILAFDLNNLKHTNDSKGHEQGDLLITEFAKILERIFGEIAVVGRMGGDEFIVIMADMDKIVLNTLLEKMKKQIEMTNEIHPELHMSVAYGFCRKDEYKGMDVKAVYRKADARMYDMKLSMKYMEKEE